MSMPGFLLCLRKYYKLKYCKKYLLIFYDRVLPLFFQKHPRLLLIICMYFTVAEQILNSILVESFVFYGNYLLYAHLFF